MRPLKLRFKGLRSYRSEQVIDFTDVGLMAIVGNTGAGKSSITEAICFALYGVPTWNARGNKQLVAQGSDGSLTVELTFQARGKAWRVTRTASATNYPPSTHRLEGLDDRTQVDDAGRVNARICELVGLDHGTFLKAVILPQGRFQELLETTPGDRTRVFRSILGLDRITDVRERAREHYDRLHPLLVDLRNRRSELLPDPQAAIDDANRQLATATKRRAELEQVEKSITDARTTHATAAQRADQCDAAAHQLTTLTGKDIEDGYRQLVDLDKGLVTQLSTVDSELETLTESQGTIEDSLAAADADGTGVAATTTAIAALSVLQSQLSDIGREQQRLDADQSSIDTESEELQGKKVKQADLVQRASETAQQADDASQAHKAALGRLDQARSSLVDTRRATRAADEATQAVEQATTRLAARTATAEEAEKAAAQADHHVDEAAAALAVAQLANAAAHAASASHPGDPCPICIRPLPAEFTPPIATSTDDAAETHAAAKRLAKSLATKLMSAAKQETTAEADLRNAVAHERTARQLRDKEVELLTAILGSVDLTAADDKLLANLQADVDTTFAAMTTAQKKATNIRDASTSLATEIREIEKAIAARQRALTKARNALAQRQETVTSTHAALPPAYQIQGPLSASGIAASLGLAQRRDRELKSVTDRLDGILKRAQKFARTRSDILSSHASTVDRPATKLARRVQALADRAAESAALINAEAPPERPSALTVAADAGWAAEVLTATKKITAACRERASTYREDAAKAETLIADTLLAADLADESVLAELLDKTKVNAGLATHHLEQATAQLPLCQDLDRRISGARPLVDSLLELSRILADAKFMAVVVKRRQRALLGLASKVLMSMTDQFAFADDFRMIDRHTGQARDVQTLSGGEKFQASLALALALVELTSRGGGRVEALFLDEGFGSLDTNALGEALEALTHQAATGRLVAVISHMRAVAEYFDNILLVRKGIGGSDARWATPAERDQLLTDELSEGLVA